MAKTYVINLEEESRVPFLRGIMTRSLQNAGLPFAEAYAIASRIRDSLEDTAEITASELSEVVAKYLEKTDHAEALQRYKDRKLGLEPIIIFDEQGSVPFSKNRLSQSLELCALSKDSGYTIALGIERELHAQGKVQLDADELAHFTYEYLLKVKDPEVVHRYLQWLEFTRSGRPLIILIGGSTGTGKSTLSAELAHRLDIVRTQSTDMLREVMRLMLPASLVPTLHMSTFKAWEALPYREKDTTYLADGYYTQAGQVTIGIEGVLRRAEREQVSLILEGIHVHPALQAKLVDDLDAIVVPVLLAVIRKKILRQRLRGRGQQVPSRRAIRYLEHFDAIWNLQSILIAEADRYHIPIIPNTNNEEDTLRLMMDTIAETLSQEFPGDPKKIFKDRAAS